MTRRWLAILYLAYAVPLAAMLAWRMPPFQGPDEDNHFLRAVQVAQLGMAAERLPDGVIGGRLPVGATRLAHGFNDWHFLSHVTLDRRRLRTADDTPWGPEAESGFANTAIYPPIYYLPAAAAIRIARWRNLNVISGLRMARLANALCAIAIAALAIELAASGSLFLFWLLSLPMTLSLYASCSQDALVISSAALSAALISRIAGRGGAFRAVWVLLALSLGCLASARPPYLLLCALPAIWARSRGKGSIATGLALLLLPVLICSGWLALGAAPVLVANQAALQLQHLIAHPYAMVSIAAATIAHDGWDLLVEFVGVLGWLDVRLPDRFYPLCLMLAGLVLAGEGGVRRTAWPLAGVTIMLIVACCAAILFALYLDWTPVGGAVIEGLQGRYFIPIAAFLALLPGHRTRYPAGFRVILPVYALATFLATIVAVERHYSAVVASSDIQHIHAVGMLLDELEA